MGKKTTESNRVRQELMEMATELSRHGLLAKPDMLRMRALCEVPPTYTSDKVLSIRTHKAKMSQSVFASFLNVSVSTVQKWEAPGSGKHPSGAAAKLLQLVEAKGVEAISV